VAQGIEPQVVVVVVGSGQGRQAIGLVVVLLCALVFHRSQRQGHYRWL
jgi:hypothetical protein